MTKIQSIYVGTYSLPIRFGTGEILEGKGKGIYLYEFDTESAVLSLVNVTESVDNPSFLEINKDITRMYAVNELKTYDGKQSGSVSAFQINSDGSLKLMNRLATEGQDPCHAKLSPDEGRLIVSNFMSGSVSVYSITKDGALGDMEQFIQYEGSSVNAIRQTSPHAHSATFSKDGKFVYIFDLGTDCVWSYRYGDAECPLSDDGMTHFVTSPGAGPRHAEFGTDGRYCYVINELESTLSVLALNTKDGSFEEIQKISTMPDDTNSKNNLCADLHIAPSGRFLYGSNRGADNIAIFRIDENNGKLTLIGIEPCGGRTPRNFAFDLTGRFLLCANQDSDCIVVFAVDDETGGLRKVSETYAPTPVCVCPVPKNRS